MRLKIELKGRKNLKIPFNYNYTVSSIIYKKIDDLKLAEELHTSTSFKFFTFSQIHFSKQKIQKDGIISKNGIISFYISSPNEKLMKSLVNGFIENTKVNYNNEELEVIKMKIIPTPKFSEKNEFKTISPIIIRAKKEIDGKLKQWDLTPSDEFFTKLEENLIKKYCKFHNLEKTDKKIKIYSEMKNIKRKRISINTGDKTTYHRAYLMDIIVEGDLDLIEFAYTAGLAEKNSMGFGMLELNS